MSGIEYSQVAVVGDWLPTHAHTQRARSPVSKWEWLTTPSRTNNELTPAPTQSSRCTCRMLPVASVINRSLSGSNEPKDTANCTAVGFVRPDTKRHDCPVSGSTLSSSPDAKPTT